jgi:hypothetical protein
MSYMKTEYEQVQKGFYRDKKTIFERLAELKERDRIRNERNQ